MLRINQLKLQHNHTEKELYQAAAKALKTDISEIKELSIQKKSLDARKKPDIFAVYAVDVVLSQEERILKRCKNKNVTPIVRKTYCFPKAGTKELRHRPVIAGSGPAGLFCAYELALHGYRPILIERGAPVEERIRCVEEFWETGKLSPVTNVQFGEGGAGTFSDGKLNTMVKDKERRGQEILNIFRDHGAPEEICYLNKPHIGTDVLAKVVKSIREDIIAHGGEVRFYTQFVGFESDAEGALCSVTLKDTSTPEGSTETLETNLLILAIGHSARDTFAMLYEKGISMEAKSFAVGVRIEHPQALINQAQYGCTGPDAGLPAADYKLTEQLENGRGVYSFCMCPGGYVVNASSEEGRLAVNGMSYHDRAGKNANSAIVVTVSKEDYGDGTPLSGVEFQRRLEEAAYRAGNGCIPVQYFKDFCRNQPSSHAADQTPQMKGRYAFGDVRNIFPEEISSSIEQGIKAFDRRIHGFANDEAVLSGVESRTSSPIRITRNDKLTGSVDGLYPCGEGAGYAGGITSAAMDGMKIAEIIAKTYKPFDNPDVSLRKI